MDIFEKQYCEKMTKISSNMDKIANSISDGFSVLIRACISANQLVTVIS